MERFAVSEQAFRPDASRDAATLYQRFAFLQSLLADEMFEAAMGQILARPHVSWLEEEQSLPPGRGARSTGRLARELARAGPRVALPKGQQQALQSLPITIINRRTEATVDNIPNQFVKFALVRWRDVVGDVAAALGLEPASGPVRRGIREATVLSDRLEAILSEELFRELGELTHFPAGSQVLQKRAGYRDLFQGYVEFELAAQLAWSGGSEVYGAGQRDVATLYEYWVFLQVARVLSALCDSPIDFATLLEIRPDGLGIDLQRGRKKVLSGSARRLGRDLRVELWFNRTFSVAQSDAWTRPMRPDVSVGIYPGQAEPASFEPIWIHLDAKYRIDRLIELFGRDAIVDERPRSDTALEGAGGARRDDLLKMHAYKDAIRRSAGAYVIYPGTQNEEFRNFHELLPGLGAFALQPTVEGQARGASLIARFLEDVLLHVASQISQHERGRYWSDQIYRKPQGRVESRQAALFLTRPPADTRVLIGYVKSAAHLEWIERTGLYNLRGDERSGRVEGDGEELAAEILVLYGVPLGDRIELFRIAGPHQVVTREQMAELAYAEPGGKAYFCLSIEKIDSQDHAEWLSAEYVMAVRQRVRPKVRPGAPVPTTWLELVRGPG
jgi:uncharacterized protein